MRVNLQRAFVLHHRSYSESSLLLETFTADHGRVGLIAKGARRPGSRLRGVLKPFQPLLLGWSGRGDLATLTGAETDGASAEITGAALYCGFYLNELLLRLLHRDDPHQSLFEYYRATLFALCNQGSNEAILRVFEKHLLRELGYGLILDREISDNERIRTDATYEYVLDRGPRRLASPESPVHAQGIRIQGASLIALAEETLHYPDVLREVKVLMRAVLEMHLGPKPLHSRRLFERIVLARGADGNTREQTDPETVQG